MNSNCKDVIICSRRILCAQINNNNNKIIDFVGKNVVHSFIHFGLFIVPEEKKRNESGICAVSELSAPC